MAMEINGAYNSVYERAYTAQKQETKKQAVSSDRVKQAKEATGSSDTKTVANQTTDEYLGGLNEKYSSLNIMAGSVNENYRGGSYPEKVDVMIAPSILKKMASDPKEAQKYERMLRNIPACERWANSAIKAMTGNEVTYRQVWIDDDGNMGSFSISEPSEAQKKWDAQRKEDEKKAFEERLEHADDGKIYLANDDIQTMINAAKEEAQGQPDKVKNPVAAGNNFDMQI